MRKFIQSAVLAGMLLAGASAYAQVSFGIRVGPPPRPRVVRVWPPRPGPDWEWVDGYWFVERGRYRWRRLLEPAALCRLSVGRAAL